MTQVSQSRQRGHISRDFVAASRETGSLFCWTWCWDDGTRDNCEEAENGAGTGEADPGVERWRSLTLKSTVIFD